MECDHCRYLDCERTGYLDPPECHHPDPFMAYCITLIDGVWTALFHEELTFFELAAKNR